jgi:hypothetical protein
MPTLTYYADLGELGDVELEVEYYYQPYRDNSRGHIDNWLPDDPEEFEINRIRLVESPGQYTTLGKFEDLLIEKLGESIYHDFSRESEE